MKMNKIKFSHVYSKFPYPVEDMDETVLMEVFTEDTSYLHEYFKNYDTHIKDKGVLDSGSYYKLPAGKVLILLLLSTHRIENSVYKSSVWTTIRRHTPEKEEYYRSIRGKRVEIVVERE